MKLDVVYVTKKEHLHTLVVSINSILRFEFVDKIFVISKRSNEKFIRSLNNSKILFIDENRVLPDMTFQQLANVKRPFFPKISGWYFQQFLKLGVSRIDHLSSNYLVVDADTVFLKEPQLFTEDGKFIFVKATEYHKPYFDNYELLMKEDPKRAFSFISQYMIFNKVLLADMFKRIEGNFPNERSWNWAIINNLQGVSAQLFSEYETYGNFVKNNFADRVCFVSHPWLRNGSERLQTMFPSFEKVESLKDEYNYVSFEVRPKSLFEKFTRRMFTQLYPYRLLFLSYFKK